jgi:hypothetical protein
VPTEHLGHVDLRIEPLILSGGDWLYWLCPHLLVTRHVVRGQDESLDERPSQEVALEEVEEDTHCCEGDAHHPAYQTESVGQSHDLPLKDDEVLVHGELDGEEGQDRLGIHHTWLGVHEPIIVVVEHIWIRILRQPRVVQSHDILADLEIHVLTYVLVQCEVEVTVYLALNRILPIICSTEILSEKLNLKLDLRDNLGSLLFGFTLFVFARIFGIQ